MLKIWWNSPKRFTRYCVHKLSGHNHRCIHAQIDNPKT